MRHAIFLVPGFFGFSQLGNINYFAHVEAALRRCFHQAGAELFVFPVSTLPTGSIRKRARLLSDAIYASLPERFDRIHVLGHSTGGLDGRLLTSPGVSLGEDADELEQAVDTVITLATPHYGTPIAGFFTNLAGKHLLLGTSLVMLLSMKGVGSTGYAWAGKLLSYLTRLDDLFGLDNTLLDYMTEHLLSDLSKERQHEINRYMHNIANDQGALLQLSAEGMDIFNAATIDNPEVAYYSYVTGAPRPGPMVIARRFRDPYFPASYALFVAMWRLSSRGSRSYPYPPFPREYAQAAEALWGRVPGRNDNDGVVPTCSQVWGTLAGMIRSDHLDVCGHFHHRDETENHTDWLRSGSHFNRSVFDLLYEDVAASFLRQPRTGGRHDGIVLMADR